MPLSSVLGLAGLSVVAVACRGRLFDTPPPVKPIAPQLVDAIVPQMIVQLVRSDPTLRPEDVGDILADWFRAGHTSWPPT